MTAKRTTIGAMLKSLMNNESLSASKQLSSKLSVKLSMRQCFALHCIVTGDHITEETRSSRQLLVRGGYLYHLDCPARTRALNGKVKKIYRLTDRGEQIYAEMVSKFQPVVDRVNSKLANNP